MTNGAGFNVAIVGCGRMGRERARAAHLLGARVDVFVDADPLRAQSLAAERAGCRALDTVDDIDWSGLDAIFVCTPPGQRGPVEERAASSRVPVFMEKPIGLSARGSLDLTRCFTRQGIIHSVGYTNRYRSSVRRARQLLEVAKPIGLACQWVGSPYGVPWWLDRSQSGGPINEQATHLVDLCRFLLGEIVEVVAMSQDAGCEPSRPGAVEHAVAVNLRFSRGVLGTLFYSCQASQKQIGATIFLSDRALRLEGWSFADRDEHETEDVYLSEVDAFFRAVRSGDPSNIESDLSDALQTQLVVDTIFESLAAGRSLAIPTGYSCHV